MMMIINCFGEPLTLHQVTIPPCQTLSFKVSQKSTGLISVKFVMNVHGLQRMNSAVFLVSLQFLSLQDEHSQLYTRNDQIAIKFIEHIHASQRRNHVQPEHSLDLLQCHHQVSQKRKDRKCQCFIAIESFKMLITNCTIR